MARCREPDAELPIYTFGLLTTGELLTARVDRDDRLAIVKAFAEAMGMSVMAGNRQDVAGARFSLRFPADLIVRDPPEGTTI